MDEQLQNSLSLLHRESNGILSTHSLEVEGFPFGSVTPYCLDSQFRPVILISDLAQHTKNIHGNNKVCLTVAETAEKESEKQALARFSYIGNAEAISKEHADYGSTAPTYLEYFPQAKNYFEAHHFIFYRINFVRGRYIGGFGKIFWIDEWNEENSFELSELRHMIDHMNTDHQDALRNYCTYYKKLNLDPQTNVKMVGLYQLGFDVLVGQDKYHFPFSESVNDSKQAREVLVKMAKESRKN